jgi:hypothetical protein
VISPKGREWNQFKRDYPRGTWGSRAGAQAAIEWQARIAEGHTGAEMLQGMYRMKAYRQATGTEKLFKAEKFIGPNKHFQDPWAPPLTKDEQRIAKNFDETRKWLALEEAKDDTV